MQSRTLIFAALMTALSMPAFAADVDNNPPGPAGGPGTNWENRPGPQGGAGASPNRQPYHRPHLSPEQREKVKAMSPDERKAFMQELRAKRAQMPRDRDNNPPGPAGGPGTNWENRPGPQGGAGASPNRQPHHRPHLSPEQREKVKAMNPDERKAFMQELRAKRAQMPRDRDNNPPGPQGGPGASPDRVPRSAP